MHRIGMTGRTLALLTVLLFAAPVAGAAQGSPVEGAWLVTSWEENPVQAGLILFTKTHYSIMAVFGEEPRATYEGQLTGDAVAAAYNPILANTGRYEIDGDQIKTRALVAKDPNYMSRWPENESVMSFRIDGDGMLHLTFGAGGPGGGQTAILRPVDDAEFNPS